MTDWLIRQRNREKKRKIERKEQRKERERAWGREMVNRFGK